MDVPFPRLIWLALSRLRDGAASQAKNISRRIDPQGLLQARSRRLVVIESQLTQ